MHSLPPIFGRQHIHTPMIPTPIHPISAARLPTGWPACSGLHQAAELLWESVSPRAPGFSAEVLAEVDSTNTELLRRARAGLASDAPTLLVAQRQTAGRGRLGRSWETAQTTALTVSLGLTMAPVDWSGLSLVVGLVLAQRLGHGVGIKWPNDLWWRGRKLCGILIETASTPEQAHAVAQAGRQAPRHVVVGMGINLATPADQGLRTPPVGLDEILRTVNGPAPAAVTDGAALAQAAGASEATLDLAACAMARFVPELVSALALFEREGFAPFEAAYAELDLLRQQPVTLSDGRAGQCVGLAHDGALLVLIDGKVEAVQSGEVSVRPA